MKKLELNQMEMIEGGSLFSNVHVGCALLGLAAGIASGLNPFVGGLVTAGCLLTTPHAE